MADTDDVEDCGEWLVTPLKDELTGDLSYEFTFPVGDGTTGTLELGNELSPKQMVKQLGRRTKMLPQRGADQFIEQMIDAAPSTRVVKARQPGWKTAPGSTDGRFVAFVTPGQIIGPGAPNFRWIQPSGRRPHSGQCAGDLNGWNKSVAKLAEKSNYLVFAIMANLAAPLLPFTDLPEDPGFNFAGLSSGGKTNALRAGASVVGHPDAIRDWNLTERKLEEAAAAHNHLVLPLNAAEKARPTNRRCVLNRVTHMVAERQSTGRSELVQDWLPDLSWQTILLGTSNKTGAQMAAELGIAWEDQDAVRFIDIPVPGPKEGGIFDRLGSEADKQVKSTELTRKLESALKKNHGVLLHPWIEHLLSTDLRRRLRKLIRRFETRTGPHNGVEMRIARKFGLLYAAGKLAVDAGLLHWPSDLPLQATMTLYHRARELRLGRDAPLDEAFGKLLEALGDRVQVPVVALGNRLNVKDEKTFVGVRVRQNGKPVIGLRQKGVSNLVGAPMVRRVFERLSKRGAIIKGHGGKTTQQLRVELNIGGSTEKKPRFLVIDPKRLRP
jgi:hypothetical protein